MHQQHEYFVYIMASVSKVLYIGFTNDLNRRVLEHKLRLKVSFTAKYYVTHLVYYEIFTSPWEGIYREKQLKKWRRSKKIWLIEQMNPMWRDLSDISEQEV